MITKEMEKLMWTIRDAARSIPVRNREDSIVMTAGNSILLLADRRGLPGIETSCQAILENMVVDGLEKKRLQDATIDLLAKIRK